MVICHYGQVALWKNALHQYLLSALLLTKAILLLQIAREDVRRITQWAIQEYAKRHKALTNKEGREYSIVFSQKCLGKISVMLMCVARFKSPHFTIFGENFEICFAFLLDGCCADYWAPLRVTIRIGFLL